MADDIPTRQNLNDAQRLLWARRALFVKGKRVLGAQLVLTVAVPVVGSIVAFWYPATKPSVALASLIIAILDPTLLDRWQKNTRRVAARMQEQFDCFVLDLPWDQFTAGDRVEPEKIHQLSRQLVLGRTDQELQDWYPPSVNSVPLQLGRIICQRTNLWYDGTLRRQYAGWALGLCIGLTVLLLAMAMWRGLTVEALVVSVFAPASPILIWGVREHFRQKDAVDTLDHLRKAADTFWNGAKVGDFTKEECDVRSRQFQNAIFERRSSNPLIFSWIYTLQRKSLEDRMNKSALDLIKEVKVTALR